MNNYPTKKEAFSSNKGSEINIRTARNIISRSCMMASLLYEIKAETPAGKTFKILINLFNEDGSSLGATIHLNSISTNALSQMAGISENELMKALAFLQEKKFITYQTSASGK